ncbi:uncharacterized protein LOC124925137 [Impatiens glandulifera]|uniref:uncharacterized protein LOC124925137 n=1 Tax=Impatiens glandulifera TaxID=253017 RepID=UPI001FB06E23|nr:uncharacterized protein LOC124925137 [Impatiens glandulifera]
MAAAIGWYGPLINLSAAASHLGDYVQLLVFVHRSTPIQYKLPKGGEVIRTDIQVGDDTRPIFPVSIWRKQMAHTVQSGSIILLENLRITKFGDTIEARTVQYSSLRCLFSNIESFGSKGVDDMVKDCRVGLCTKEKLKKVVEWVQRKGYTLIRSVKSYTHKEGIQQPANWKVLEERESQDFLSLLEVSLLTNSCEAKFYASVGDIFLPLTSKNSCEFEDDRMFIRRRLFTCKVEELAEDLICTGCKLCGFPLNCEMGSMLLELNTIPLYCPKSSNHVHQISSIYRPFVLYVWDDSSYIPLLVRNKAAQFLFGNIEAEAVKSSCRSQQCIHTDNPKCKLINNDSDNYTRNSTRLEVGEKRLKGKGLLSIWLILLKVLLEQEKGKNSPIRFKVAIDVEKDHTKGRFELTDISLRCGKQ